MRIIVTGLVGQYAFGGVAWDYLQFVEGFRQLGHDVFYLEDTEMWPYDPIQNTISNDCRYNVKYLGDVMEKFGLGDRWIYRNAPDGSYHGRPETETKAICATADVFLNVSGCGWLRPEYLRIPKKIFLDSDPLFTQVALVSGKQDVIDRIRAHDFHFTFAENIHARDCRIPAAGFRWIPTRQPIVLEWWHSSRRHAAAPRVFWVCVPPLPHACPPPPWASPPQVGESKGPSPKCRRCFDRLSMTAKKYATFSRPS